MQDKIEKIGNGSLIQHGNLNKRVYLMKLDKKDSPMIIHELNNLAQRNRYTKIFCKIPAWVAPLFFANGFILEAHIPRCLNNKEAVFFVSKFLNSDRLLEIETAQLHELSEMFVSSKNKANNGTIGSGKFTVKKLKKEDFERIAEIYRTVFITYPFPIYKSEYILKSFDEGVQYFGAISEGKIVALASAEVDAEGQNAEMTDFATLPDHRGQNLSLILLNEIEKVMKEEGICTLHTIARLNSVGMNKTFQKMNYTYSGTLIKNTNIAGKIESMNVYYKHI